MNHLFIILGLSVVSSVGLVIFFLKQINQKILHLLIAIGGGTILSVSLVHILPESLETSEWSIYAFVAGFLLIYIFEEILTPHKHDHHHDDHTHEDPHEHMKHVALVSWVAICIHTLLDGVGIRAGMALDPAVGMSILAGVAIHQIPVSLCIASMLRGSAWKRRTQMILTTIFGLSASIGYIFSGEIVVRISDSTLGLITALAGGSLLYVSNVEFLPMIHAHSSSKMKFATVSLFVIGVVVMSTVALYE